MSKLQQFFKHIKICTFKTIKIINAEELVTSEIFEKKKQVITHLIYLPLQKMERVLVEIPTTELLYLRDKIH